MSAEAIMEKLYAADAATRAGVKLKTWQAYVSRGQAPEPDGYQVDRQYVRPWWHPETIHAFASRTKRPGARTDVHARTHAVSDPEPRAR